MTRVLEFRELHLPRPLDEAAVVRVTQWLAAAHGFPVVAFEARATRGVIRHLVGVLPGQSERLARGLQGVLPDLRLSRGTPARDLVQDAGKVAMWPTTLGLSVDDLEGTVRALLAALAEARAEGELLVVQLILGPRLRPKNLPRHIQDPQASLWRLLTVGPDVAPAEVRTQTRTRIGQLGFSAVLRLGVSASSRTRRRQLIFDLFSAVRTVQSPGVRIELRHARARSLDRAVSPWHWPIRLGAGEVPAFLTWPLGEEDLPGIRSVHPRPLAAASGVRERERVFARSFTAGGDRLLGLSATDGLQHLLVLGPTGVGKSTALLNLIRADLDAGRAIAVIDPKRDLIEDVLAQVPQNRWDDVVLLDAVNPQAATFNPLQVRGRDPDVVADGLLAVFEAVFADGWGPRTADILSAGLRTLTRAQSQLGGATLVDLPRLLTDARYRQAAVRLVGGDAGLAGFWDWYEGLGPAGQASVVAAPMNKLRQLLLRPALVRMIGDSAPTVELSRVFSDQAILLVPLNEAVIGPGTANLLGSLVVAELWNATQARATRARASRTPATVVLDEAHRFLNLPLALSDALAVSRGLGVGWELATQYRGQFPPDLRAAVDTNARSTVAFSLQPEDATYFARTTRDLIADDFQALGPYEAYLRLVAQGHPTSWALARTLPPPTPRHDPKTVRQASRGRRTLEPTAPREPAPSTPPVTAESGRPGRKRRPS